MNIKENLSDHKVKLTSKLSVLLFYNQELCSKFYNKMIKPCSKIKVSLFWIFLCQVYNKKILYYQTLAFTSQSDSFYSWYQYTQPYEKAFTSQCAIPGTSTHDLTIKLLLEPDNVLFLVPVHTTL